MTTTHHPKEDRDLTREQHLFRAAVRAYYEIPGNSCGGQCHVVLDDNNLDDASVQFCLDACLAKADWFGAAIMQALLKVPAQDREETLDPWCQVTSDGPSLNYP